MTSDFPLQMEPEYVDYEELEALIERDRELRDDIARDEKPFR
jgi:hypothetical protein